MVTKARKSASSKTVAPKAKKVAVRTRGAKEALFVAEYLKDRNGTQAAIRAGYSPKTAHQTAYELLRKPEIAARIRENAESVAAIAGLTVERTLREVARIAYFDPRKLFNKDGQPLQLHELDDDTAAAIQGVEVLEEWEGSGADRRLVGLVKKYKVADKNSALDKAMKHLGQYETDNKQSNPVDAMASLLSKISASGSRLPISRGDKA